MNAVLLWLVLATSVVAMVMVAMEIRVMVAMEIGAMVAMEVMVVMVAMVTAFAVVANFILSACST